MESGDIENQRGEEIGLIKHEKLNPNSDIAADKEHNFLTREDLLKLDTKEPVWRRARIGLVVAFWIIWLGLLATSVIIIVFSPKCPPKPTLEFWQEKVGYWFNPFAFKDSDGDLIGDFKGRSTMSFFNLLGVMEKLNYITDEIGAGFIILDTFLAGTFTNTKPKLGLVESFTEVDAALGSMEDFRTLIRLCRRNGVDVHISRTGEHSGVTINGKTFYSVGDKDMVDLDLQNPDVIHQIKATNTWFTSYPSSQIFVNNSVHLVQVIRQVVDGYHKSGSRQKVLLVDVGDTGYGLRDVADDALMFLGTEEIPGAHMVVSREFVRDRGWKAPPNTISWLNSSITSYDISSDQKKSSLVLATATTNDRIYSDMVSFALTLLLPGTPVLYSGAELNTAYAGRINPPTSIYPKGKVPFPNLDNRDSVLSCHLPMPWDSAGKGFSVAADKNNFTTYLRDFEITETVQSMLSVGREPTLFCLMKRLIKLRENPSLLWGKFRRIFEKDAYANEVFVRQAEGFPAFIIVFVRNPSVGGRVYDFTVVCPEVRNHVVFPLKPTLPHNVPLRSDRIYVDAVGGRASLYVFECM